MSASQNPIASKGVSTLTVKASTTGLSPGIYAGNVAISGGGKTVNVSVSLQTGPPFEVDASNSNFCQGTSFSPPVSCQFNLNAGGTAGTDSVAVLNFTASSLSLQVSASSNGGWLKATPSPTLSVPASSGGNPGKASLTISVDPSKLPPGTYTGSVIISGGGASVTIAVTVQIGGISVALSPSPVSITVQAGKKSSPVSIHMVDGSKGTTLTSVGATIQSNQSWLTVSGFDGSNFALSADATTFRAGPQSATVTVQYNGSGSPFVTVVLGVTLQVTPPATLNLSPSSLTFNAYQGHSNPPTQNVTVTSSDGSSIGFSVLSAPPWAQVSPSAGTASATTTVLNITANTSALPAGPTSGSIVFNLTNGGAAATLNLTVNISQFSISAGPSQPAPVTLASGKTQTFALQIGTVDNSSQPVNVSATTDNGGSWLTVPSIISAPASLNVTVSAGTLAAATYTGHLQLSCPNSGCASISVPVTLTVSSTATIVAQPTSLSFQPGQGASLPGSQTVNLTASDQTQQGFTFSFTPQGSWLQVSANQMNTPASLTVSVVSLPAQNSSGSITVVPADGAPATTIPVTFTANTSQPTIQPGGVIFSGNFGAFHTITSGTYAEIYGSKLSATTRGWAISDFTGPNQTQAPQSLDGVSVQVDGKTAFVNYVSPGQVNIVVPDGISVGGTVQLTLKNASGTTAPFNIQAAAAEPGLLAPPSFLLNGKQYVVAFLPDGSYVLPTGAIPGLNSRPAKPNETITLYGLGFGPVTPAVPSGVIAGTLNGLQASLQVTFGNTPANVSYNGLAPGYVGLYQINLVVPPVPDSDAVPLLLNLGGVPGSQTLFIAVHQ